MKEAYRFLVEHYELETQWGFGRFGAVHLGDGPFDNVLRIPGLLDAVKARLITAEDHARSILSARRRQLESIAGELDRRGYLSRDDVQAMLSNGATTAATRAAAE